MTMFPLGKSVSNQQEPAFRNALRFAALLFLMLSMSVLTFVGVNAAVNASAPRLAEMRIQSAVNLLNRDGLDVQQQQAMRDLENAGEGAVPALIVALRSENPTLRRNAADMLGFIASPQALTALRYTLFNDPAPVVRRNSAWALGEIKDFASLNGLEQAAVLDKSQAVRETAADSIARIRTRAAMAAGINESAVSAFASAPGDSNRAYLATGRDLVATSDGGRSWTTHTNALPSVVTTLESSPTDANVLYASADGLGMFKSTNGGITWSAINSGIGLAPGARFSVTAIAIDATNPQRLFATTGVWLGTSQLEFFPLSVMRSVDSGTTWQLYHEDTGAHPITQLAIQGERLYALAGDHVLIY